MRILRWFIGLLILTQPLSVVAGQRVALVVGNANYQVGRLANPLNDARDIAKVLRQVGFQVDLVQDSNRSNLHRAVQNFRRKLNGRTEVALFFYAGHGAQFEGDSYLLPLRANIQSAADLPVEGLKATDILTQMRTTGSRVNLMILDACRNLPYPALNRSPVRGLARVQTPGSALLAYATAPGQIAADGRGRNSPYTAQLLKSLQKPGVALSQLFNDVGFAVHRATGGRQTPWVSSSPMPPIYLGKNQIMVQQQAQQQAATEQKRRQQLAAKKKAEDDKIRAAALARWHAAQKKKEEEKQQKFIQPLRVIPLGDYKGNIVIDGIMKQYQQ